MVPIDLLEEDKPFPTPTTAPFNAGPRPAMFANTKVASAPKAIAAAVAFLLIIFASPVNAGKSFSVKSCAIFSKVLDS